MSACANNIDSDKMNDALRTHIQEQVKWIASLKEFKDECEEETKRLRVQGR